MPSGPAKRKGFKQVEKTTINKELFGELIEGKSGEEKLNMRSMQTCARGGLESECGPWTFSLEDGYEREFPMEMSGAGIRVTRTFKAILHLDDEE